MSKARIFVDFWNFQLSVINIKGDQYRIDWTKLSPWLMQKSRSLVDPQLSFEGMRVYLSYHHSRPEDLKLRDWANNFLDRVPGVDVRMVERKSKNPPVCPACHRTIDPCPYCGSSTSGTIEKGVDTAIVTDLLSLAWESAWDIGILVTSDRDFIPAVDMLHRKGYKVINAHFPPAGMELAKACWASLDLGKALKQISR
jgi:uncharacterized LabA/DUF88 family protein